MFRSSTKQKVDVLVINLNRHYDLLNLAEYVEGIVNLRSKTLQAKILVSQKSYDGVQVKHLCASRVNELVRTMFKEQPSWIYITGPSRLALIALCLHKILFRKQAITHLHRFDYNSYSRMKSVTLKLYNAVVTHLSDYCVVHSESVASISPKYLYAPLPFHVKRGNVKKIDKTSDLNVLFFGRIDRNKGLIRVLELAKLMPTTNFFVFGEVVDENQNEIVESLQDLSNCKVSAKRVLEAELPDIFADKDVVLLPYFDGTQSGIPNLSAVYGVPVLSTPFGDVAVTIDANRCGIYNEYSASEWSRILKSTDWSDLSDKIIVDTRAVDQSYVKILENYIDHS